MPAKRIPTLWAVAAALATSATAFAAGGPPPNVVEVDPRNAGSVTTFLGDGLLQIAVEQRGKENVQITSGSVTHIKENGEWPAGYWIKKQDISSVAFDVELDYGSVKAVSHCHMEASAEAFKESKFVQFAISNKADFLSPCNHVNGVRIVCGEAGSTTNPESVC